MHMLRGPGALLLAGRKTLSEPIPRVPAHAQRPHAGGRAPGRRVRGARPIVSVILAGPTAALVAGLPKATASARVARPSSAAKSARSTTTRPSGSRGLPARPGTALPLGPGAAASCSAITSHFFSAWPLASCGRGAPGGG